MKKRLLTMLLCVALVIAVAVVTAQAEDPVDYTVDYDFVEGGTFYCPVCKDDAQWYPLPAISASAFLPQRHYYVDGTVNSASFYKNNASNKGTYCIHLNNGTINSTSNEGTFSVGNGSIINILGNGTISSARLATLYTGTVNVYSGSVTTSKTAVMMTGDNSICNIYGGTVNGIDAAKGKLTVAGGTVNSNLNVYSSLTSATFSGAPVVENLIPQDGRTLTIGELTEGAALKLVATTATNKNFSMTGDVDAALEAGYIYAKDSSKMIKDNGDGTYTIADYVHQVDCPHCEGTDLVTFTAWDGTGALTTGHYYLAGDTTAATARVAGADSAGNNIVIDLNGNDLTVNTRWQVMWGNTLSVMDSKTGGTVKAMAFNGSTESGGLISNLGVFNLYSGTIQEATDCRAYKEGLVYVYNTGVFNMYGGTIIPGTKMDTSTNGGAVHLYDSTNTRTAKFYMYDGTINGGTAVNGGAVYVGTKGIFEMQGGTITAGTATKGDTIYVGNADSKVTISGDAKIDGGVWAEEFTSLTVSGTPVIQKLEGGSAYSLYLASGKTLTLGALSEGASIGITAEGTFATGDNAASVVGYFTADDSKTIEATSNSLVAEANVNGPLDPTSTTCPLCGDTDITWTKLTKITTGTALAPGHYYVDGTLTNGSYYTVAGKTCVHLNGGQLSSESSVGLFNVSKATGSALNIFGDGTVGGNHLATVYAATLNVYGGTINTTGAAVVMESDYATCNIYGGTVNGITADQGTLKVTGGTITGDLTASGTLASATFSGAPVVENLVPSDGRTLDISGLTAGASLTLNSTTATDKTFKVTGDLDAAVEAGYIRVATGKSITETTTTGTYTISESLYQVDCPHCEGTDLVTFTKWDGTGTLTTGHYYLDGNITAATARVAGEANVGNDVVLDLNGKDLTVGTRWQVTGGNTLSVIDSKGGATVNAMAYYAAGEGAQSGGLISILGTFNLYGGTIQEAADCRAYKDGLVYVYIGSTFNMYDGTITAANSTKMTATNGAAVHLAASTSNATAKFNMYNGTITGGTAATGGAVYVGAKGNFKMENGTINGGTVTGHGGTVDINAGTFTMSGGTLNAGTTGSGGASRGDAIVVQGQGTFNMTGGTVNASETSVDNGGIYALGGHVKMSGNATVITHVPKATGVYGNGVAVLGLSATKPATLTLDGNATVVSANGEKETNIFLSAAGGLMGQLIVKDTWTGSASITVNGLEAGYGTEIPAAYGEVVDGAADGIGAFTGNLYYEGMTAKPNVWGNGATLVISGAELVSEDGSTWYLNNAAAIAAAQDGQYLKLHTAEDVVLTKDMYVDFNGYEIGVSGAYNLYGMDAANDDFNGAAGVTVTDATVAETAINPVNGNQYIAIANGAKTSFRRIDLRIKSVSIRPSSAGIYYTGIWECDNVVKAQLGSYGVAVSTVNMPEANFMDEDATQEGIQSDTAWSAYAPDTFVSGVTKTGVLIKNILKSGLDTTVNEARGAMPIYAAAYAVVNGKTIVSTDEVAHSLKTAMQLIDEKAYSQNSDALESFYADWEDVMSGWELVNTGNAANR